MTVYKMLSIASDLSQEIVLSSRYASLAELTSAARYWHRRCPLPLLSVFMSLHQLSVKCVAVFKLVDLQVPLTK